VATYFLPLAVLKKFRELITNGGFAIDKASSGVREFSESMSLHAFVSLPQSAPQNSRVFSSDRSLLIIGTYGDSFFVFNKEAFYHVFYGGVKWNLRLPSDVRHFLSVASHAV